jgi:dGTPase
VLPYKDHPEVRIRLEELEDRTLSRFAARSADASGRREPQEDDPLRTSYQRDRDRVIHCKAFRRLKHKTQVFIAPKGDHYRTRLTHTMEVTQVARTIARALRLNEDLTEAIGLGHDLGHTPFGHAGEEALDRALQERFERRFRHNEHSLRAVDVLERDGRGLNLTEEVRDGILRHTGPDLPATLEGRIVRLVDRIAYVNHDIDDALRAGVLAEADLPREEITVLGDSGSERIDCLVHDLVETSEREGDIVQGDEVGGAMARLRKFMFEHVYFGEAARREQERVTTIIETLLEHHLREPGAPQDQVTRAVDYVAGMTDRFCIREFERLTVPRALDVDEP